MSAADSDRGNLYVIAAPSGAGKTTLVHALMAAVDNLKFSVSYTTRPRRSTETDGKDYFFVTTEAFRAMIAAGDFLEYADVFDYQYGTSKKQVEAILNRGHSVILEIDWQGAQQVRKQMADCRSIFVLPPSLDELKRRLTGRGTDTAEVIERRFRDAVDDMSHWREFDYVIVNDDLAAAKTDLMSILGGRGEHLATAEPAVVQRIEAILGA